MENAAACGEHNQKILLFSFLWFGNISLGKKFTEIYGLAAMLSAAAVWTMELHHKCQYFLYIFFVV